MKDQLKNLFSSQQKGRVVIHNSEGKEKRVYPEELNYYLKNGWIKGISPSHKKNNSVAHIGKAPSNKGVPVSRETKEKISNTLKNKYKTGEICCWNKGKTDLQQSWNKGLTKETDERVKKMSDSKKGHEVTQATRDKIRKSNTGKKFGKRNPEVGQKISKSKMGHPVSQETRDRLSKKNKGKKLSPEKLLIKTTKQYLTRKKNNSFNTSKSEEELYTFLLKENINKTIYRNYKCDRYPFYCDFYILEDDLFIELNAHWTHGGRPFDERDPECIQKLNEWKEKSKTSQFYVNAIETWTIRDVKKQKIAKENNLNYKVIY